ncbi:hypothetical protein P154DRAFT_551348 [Amniculicola lignicola CBS 123094]|uniref:Enhancer of mRNA-decapping protein 3 n=1 Tax=Amniculicola lignicola CBS 123094 TaxID=1392246 RepID=A0A6A5X1I2_9PLEO|nr:hypothetical protein P154DRAFT_551348 [Amniculicola lignicola CBS 123094]
MADQTSSIRSRIAALNLEEVHTPSPGDRPVHTYEQALLAKKRPPPPPPPAQRPQTQLRQQSVNNPPIMSHGPLASRQQGDLPNAAPKPAPKISPALPPRLPPRTSSQPPPPSLPPRKSSEHSIRRQASTESVSTIASARSNFSIGSAKTSMSTASNGGQMYQVRAPAFDPSKLPLLPPKKTEEKKPPSATLRAMKSTTNIVPSRTLPPQLPARPPLPKRQETAPYAESLPPKRDMALPPQRSALSFGMNKATETPPPLPTSRPSANPVAEPGAPPPIPMSSRPNLAAIMASKPKPGAVASCLKCRDYSGPDSHATQFPRDHLPNSNVGWLAAQLTSPFSSPTDKARVIFTWLHHNIDYDTQNFFAGTVSRSTPETTITSGLAVCEGYASLFAALALKAGLEAVVVSGHGKGFGHHALKPGDPLPPFKCGHAWNAVRIDNGEWKLIDPCWGAGHLKTGTQQYQRSFTPSQFTMDNDEFGTRHFPQDDRYFFRTDGRASITWQEYMMDDMGERLQVYGDATKLHGLGGRTFQPTMKHINVYEPNDPLIRFQFATQCIHWDNERHGSGKPYVMVLHVGGRDGRKTDWIPFNTDGKVWWVDMQRADLGAPGQKVNVYAVTIIDGRDARGVSYEEYARAKGRKAMSFGGVAMWELPRSTTDCLGAALQHSNLLSSQDSKYALSPCNLQRTTALCWHPTRTRLRNGTHYLNASAPSGSASRGITAPRAAVWDYEVWIPDRLTLVQPQCLPGTVLPTSLLAAIMASGLIGISVLVTLRNPPNTQVQGLVAAVNPTTSTLTLRNVLFPATGHRLDGYNVEGHAIADIKVPAPPPQLQQHNAPPMHTNPPYPQYSNENEAPSAMRGLAGNGHGGRKNGTSFGSTAPPAGGPFVQSQPQQQPAQSQPSGGVFGAPVPQQSMNARPQQQPFMDPAIVSVGKRSTMTTPAHQPVPSAPQEAPATPIKPFPAAQTAVSPAKKNTPLAAAVKERERNMRKPSAATLEGPFSSLDIADAGEPDSDEGNIGQTELRRVSISKTRTGKPMEPPVEPPPLNESALKTEESYKRTRRGGKARKKEIAAQERRNGTDIYSSPDAARKGKGSGWRSTPLLQPEAAPVRTPGVIGGKVGIEAAHASNRKTKRQRALEAKNGWATEDATDIQELPEFDFAENLSKFDKRTVFNQIRNEDTTADEDRLVSFNRLARPGTHGGKNLHPTENVLDSKRLKSASNSSSDEDLSDFGSGRNSRRAMSRASLKRIPMRQGSAVQPDLDTLSQSGAPSSLVARAAGRTFINRQYASSSIATASSPKPGRLNSPPDSPRLDSNAPRSCLRIMPTNRRCNTITPGGMLAVEESAEIDFGLTEDMMAENAGRGIAEVALSAINPGGRRLARENPNPRPVIVVLAGNHRGGARAIAAARQLQARGPKVMVALLGFERTADWDRDVRRQVDLFKKFGGTVRGWLETEDALKRLQAPPELIVDALLSRHKEFDALHDDDRRTVLAIVGWANKSRAAVLAVETPSGVGGSTGEVAILQGEPLEVRAKYIVCLGAPRTGLLKALQNGAGREPQWLIWVVDIGVNQPWRNAGIGGGKGVKFGENWIVQARFEEEGV